MDSNQQATIMISSPLSRVLPTQHQVTHIAEISFENPQEPKFLAKFGCICCFQRHEGEWLTRASLVHEYGVSDERIVDIESWAEREFKERETRRISKQMSDFLFFRDITDFLDFRQIARFEYVNPQKPAVSASLLGLHESDHELEINNASLSSSNSHSEEDISEHEGSLDPDLVAEAAAAQEVYDFDRNLHLLLEQGGTPIVFADVLAEVTKNIKVQALTAQQQKASTCNEGSNREEPNQNLTCYKFDESDFHSKAFLREILRNHPLESLKSQKNQSSQQDKGAPLEFIQGQSSFQSRESNQNLIGESLTSLNDQPVANKVLTINCMMSGNMSQEQFCSQLIKQHPYQIIQFVDPKEGRPNDCVLHEKSSIKLDEQENIELGCCKSQQEYSEAISFNGQRCKSIQHNQKCSQLLSQSQIEPCLDQDCNDFEIELGKRQRSNAFDGTVGDADDVMECTQKYAKVTVQDEDAHQVKQPQPMTQGDSNFDYQSEGNVTQQQAKCIGDQSEIKEADSVVKSRHDQIEAD